MLRAHKEGRKLRVVSDQIGTPTYTPDLARVMVDLIDLNPFPGIYHAAGPDVTNWYEFAKLVIETCTGSPAEIEPIKTEDWPTPAKRPRYSALSFEKVAALGIKPMRPLWAAVEDFCGRVSDGS
jgi:dTDP-4-dehydrorhamnose reductase